MRRGFILLALVVSCARREEPPRRVQELAASMSPSALPDAPVSGVLAGRAFTMRGAWLRVTRRPGQERVDLVLSEGRPSRLCARPTPDDARQVVVRFLGVTRLSMGEARIEPDSPRREVFVEAPRGVGVVGRGGGSALVVVARADDGGAEGRLRACAPLPEGGCVSGTFSAQACWDELDLDGPRGARDRLVDGSAP